MRNPQPNLALGALGATERRHRCNAGNAEEGGALRVGDSLELPFATSPVLAHALRAEEGEAIFAACDEVDGSILIAH